MQQFNMTSPRRKKHHTKKKSHRSHNGKTNGETNGETAASEESDFAAVEAVEAILTIDTVAVVSAVFGFALYANAIWLCGFCYDDRVAIEENPDVLNTKEKETSSLLQIFEHDFWGAKVTDESSHKSYRPLAIFSLRFDAWISHALGAPGKAWVFHLFNALLYALACWMLVKFVLSTIGSSQQKNSNPKIALLLSGLWFAAHPIHVESVTGLVGRADILAAIFCILGFNFHASGRAVGCVLSFAAACLCKETSVVIPTVLAVADITKLVLSRVSKPQHPAKVQIWLAPALVAVSIGYIAFRSWLFGSSQTLADGVVSLTDNFIIHLPPPDKLRTAIWIQVRYILLLLWPNKLSCDYGLGVIDPVKTWASLEMLHSVTMVFLTLLLARYSFMYLYQTGDVAPLVALGWIAGPLIPASHVVNIGTVMAERLLFLPSIGAAMLLCHGLGTLGKRSFLTWTALILCIAVFSFKTITRNPDWASSKGLFAADLKTYPQSLKMLISNLNHGDIDVDTATHYAETSLGVLNDNFDVFSAESVEAVHAEIMLRMADFKTNSSDASEAVLYADTLIDTHGISGDTIDVKAHAKKGRALLKVGVENNDVATLRLSAEAYKKATQAGKIVDDLYWFDINEGKGRACYEVWKSTGEEAMLRDSVDGYNELLQLGDVYGDNDERLSDIMGAAGTALFSLGGITNDPEVFRQAVSALEKAIKVGPVSTAEHWADLNAALGKTLLKLGPMIRDIKMVKRAEVLLRTSIESLDTDDQVQVHGMLGTALAMLDKRMAAYEEFQECFRREKIQGKTNSWNWEHRFGNRVNYAVLMQKLSGVDSNDKRAIQQWGSRAIKAIDKMLAFSKHKNGPTGGDGSVLPAEQLQRWRVVKSAIKGNLDRAAGSEL